MLDLPVPCPYCDEHNEGLFLRDFHRGVIEDSDLPGGDVEFPPPDVSKELVTVLKDSVESVEECQSELGRSHDLW
jgi:hypothetical protein